MIRRDNIAAVIEWSQNDNFWRSNGPVEQESTRDVSAAGNENEEQAVRRLTPQNELQCGAAHKGCAPTLAKLA